MRAGLAYLCAGTPRFSFSFFLFFLLCLLLLLPYQVVCVTPSLRRSSSLFCGRHGTTAVTRQVCFDHYSLCVCAVCIMMHVRVCRCVRLRICVLEPHIYLFHNFLFSPLRCCCCRIMSSASHRASSSQALYYVTVTVQQQLHNTFV